VSRAFVLNPLAEDDLADSRRWYNRQQPGLGDEFLEEAEAAFARIQRSPEVPVPAFQDLRKVLMNRFPYHVIYRVDDDQITVVAVYNARRDPRGWQVRV
jgi:plasmid stabilization system protein ParE